MPNKLKRELSREKITDLTNEGVQEFNEGLTKEEPSEFIKEQYIQLNEHRRQVNSFSWQTPAIIFGALVLTLGLTPKLLDDWRQTPLIPAIGFLAIAGFMFVIWSSHIRNQITRRWLDGLIKRMEIKHGKRPIDYKWTNEPRGEWFWQRIHSSNIFSVFLFLLTLVTALASLYFFAIKISKMGI